MRVVAFCALLSLLLVPAGAAQGPPLDVETNTIWNQYTNSPSCCTTFGSTMNEDPRFSGSGNYGTLVLLPAASSTSFVLRYELTPEEFPHVLILDPDGTVDFTVHLGGGISTGGAVGVANVNVAVSLTLGDTVVASGSGQSVLDHAGDGYKKVTYSVAPSVTRLDPAEGPLAWTLRLTGTANGVYVSHTDANGNGYATLPIVAVEGGSPAPQVLYADLDAPAVEHAFQNATSDTHVLNFTTDLVNSTASFSWNATAGSVNATLADGNGTILFEGMFEGNGTLDHSILGAVPGPWNLTLDYTGYNGTFGFALAAPAEGPAPGDGLPDDGAADETAGNGTLEDGKDSPVPALVPVLGLLAAVMARRRR